MVFAKIILVVAAKRKSIPRMLSEHMRMFWRIGFFFFFFFFGFGTPPRAKEKSFSTQAEIRPHTICSYVI